MIKNIKIDDHIIGFGKKPFVIAEAGVNHNGSLDLALKLVDAASNSGAQAIKFQTFKANQVVTNKVSMAKYQKENIGKTESQIEMLRKLELKDEFYPKIVDYCKKKNILFLSTPHGSFESIDLLQNLKVPAFKFGSGDLTNLPALQYAAKFKKPLILGTGMATLTEVIEAIRTIKNTGNNKIIVLHCTTDYPCPFDSVNLRAMQMMIKKLNCLVGYSDHTSGSQVPIMAVTLGACLIEKHFTLDRNMEGPDHKASMEPDELKDMIDSLQLTTLIMGSDLKKPTPQEIRNIKIIRKSVVSIKNIKKGDKFTRSNIDIKRPGNGLHPRFYFSLIGKRAKRNINTDTVLNINDLA